jgi:2-oxoglutarate dehydrogenase complex dehydrogenase (E1) component-like enzyme
VSSAAPEFGPNDWFVEEKYQQFLADPKSVDPIWRDFFADAKAPSTLIGVSAANGAV